MYPEPCQELLPPEILKTYDQPCHIFWQGWLKYTDQGFQVPYICSSIGQHRALWHSEGNLVGERRLDLKWEQFRPHTMLTAEPDRIQILPWPGMGAFECPSSQREALRVEFDHQLANQQEGAGMWVTCPKGRPIEEARVWQSQRGYFLMDEPKLGIKLIYGTAITEVMDPPYWHTREVDTAVKNWDRQFANGFRLEGEGRKDPAIALAQIARGKREFARHVCELAGLTAPPTTKPSVGKGDQILKGGIEMDEGFWTHK